MKKDKLISLIIISIMLLTACGQALSAPGGETNAAAADITTSAAIEETEPGFADDLPEDLDFGGQVVKIYMGGKYSLAIEPEDSADIINDLIFKRNVRAEERLNLKIETEICPEAPWDNMSKYVKNLVMSGSNDISLICGANWYNSVFALNHWVQDLSQANYIDTSRDWWAGGYINGMSYAGKYYYVTGPIELGYISGMMCFFANMKVWDNFYGGNVHDMVRDGSWTLDKLNQLGEGVYSDLNGTGIADDGDLFGFALATDFTVERNAYGCGVAVAPFDENGTPHLAFIENPSQLISFWDKWYNIKTNPLFITVIWNSEKMPNTDMEMIRIFKQDELLFFNGSLSYSTSYLRDMESDYAILPMTKLDESQKDYVAVLSDGMAIYSIPVTASEYGRDAALALLEACSAESYTSIIPAYLDDALKNKYIRDTESIETINMLAVHPMNDFGALYLDLGFYSFLRSDVKNADIASAIAKKAKSFQKTLDKMLEKLSDAE